MRTCDAATGGHLWIHIAVISPCLPIIPHGNSPDDLRLSTNGLPTTSENCDQPFTLQIARECIQYAAADIPDPPAISFVHDLASLDRLWDDTSPQWNNASPLYIRGKSIALIYWPSVYRYRGTQQWSCIKQHWFEWKVC
jgi:hypothetical protein